MRTQEKTAGLVGVGGTQGSSGRARAEEVTGGLPSLPTASRTLAHPDTWLSATPTRVITDLNFSEGTPLLASHLIPLDTQA